MIVCWDWKHDPASDAGFSRIILLNGDKVKRMSKGVRAGKGRLRQKDCLYFIRIRWNIETAVKIKILLKGAALIIGG